MKRHHHNSRNEYDRTISYLYSLERKGMDLDLGRIRRLMKELGNPERTFKSVHVAGTNGKGSVCAMLASLLKEAGFKVGVYTSPHLVSFNERIVVDGEQISNDDVVRLFKIVRPRINELKLTFFEVVTAMAFVYFAEKKVDYAVVETGLGGRLDA
ncbi:bifunctional folylpolyglutamate synthase/dihydrofolate synthase, partial [Candidatus Woesearchaeota archaeon]